MIIIKMRKKPSLRISAGIIYMTIAASGFCGSLAFGQTSPPKVQPGQVPGNQSAKVSEGQNIHVVGTGFTADNASGVSQEDCRCYQKKSRWRLFRKDCRLHQNVDLSQIPNPYEEIPLGLQITEIMKTQVRSYENSRQIFYQYDFIDGKAELNQAGIAKLGRISQQVFMNFSPIIIENTPREPGLDLARRVKLVNLINSQGIPIPSERIIVSGQLNHATSGPDAMILYNGAVGTLQKSSSSASTQGGSVGTGVSGLSGTGLQPNTQSTQGLDSNN